MKDSSNGLSQTQKTNKKQSLTALRTFNAVTTLGSISKASEHLGVTHAAISQQISLLEAAVGKQLFTRNGRKLVLSDHARDFAREIRRAFDIIDAAIAEVSEQYRSVKIGAPQDVLVTRMTDAIARIQTETGTDFWTQDSKLSPIENFDLVFYWTLRRNLTLTETAIQGPQLVMSGTEEALANPEIPMAVMGKAMSIEGEIARDHGREMRKVNDLQTLLSLCFSGQAIMVTDILAVNAFTSTGVLKTTPVTGPNGAQPRLVISSPNDPDSTALQSIRVRLAEIFSAIAA